MENKNYNEDLHREMVTPMNYFRQGRTLTIGMQAPDFIADTTFGRAKMSDYYGKWLIFFSHPRGFYTSMYN